MQNRYNKFTLLISNINKCIQKIKAKEMELLSLKGAYVNCILNLNNSNGLTLNELKNLCNEDKSAVSRTISSLENLGFISYSKNTTEKYNNLITLTQKGKEVAKIIEEKVNELFCKCSTDLNLSKRDDFYNSLELISLNLQQLSDNYGGKNER